MPDYPQVALEFMNLDHAEFVALRDKLLVLLQAQTPGNEADSLLDELFEHTSDHFAEEERLMLEYCFPPYPVHKSEHDQVLADIAAQIERWKYGRDAAATRDWLDKAVGNWLITHVTTMDFVTAGFIEMKQKAK